MLDNNLFVEEQHGFLPGRSCVTQLLEVLDDWFLHYDNSIPIDVIYLDMAKAFDSVPHKRLLCTSPLLWYNGQSTSMAPGLVNRQTPEDLHQWLIGSTG